jgi:hypothetical protein
LTKSLAGCILKWYARNEEVSKMSDIQKVVPSLWFDKETDDKLSSGGEITRTHGISPVEEVI